MKILKEQVANTGNTKYNKKEVLWEIEASKNIAAAAELVSNALTNHIPSLSKIKPINKTENIDTETLMMKTSVKVSYWS